MLHKHLPDFTLTPHLDVALPTGSTDFTQVYCLPSVFAQNFSAEKYA